mmetsp:Transcript_39291/g.100372  ORF Transcript_39291/g.100372 Transcript_39291/m.100372 type:complete len:337 (+) Transcript_39291:40-1050(+)
MAKTRADWTQHAWWQLCPLCWQRNKWQLYCVVLGLWRKGARHDLGQPASGVHEQARVGDGRVHHHALALLLREVARPEPVAGEEVVDVLDAEALGFGDEAHGECQPQHDPGGEVQEDAPRHGAQHGGEGLPDEEGGQEVGAHRDGLPHGAAVQRLHLVGDDPRQAGPRPGVAGKVDDDHGEEHAGEVRRERGALAADRKADGDDQQRDQHLQEPLNQQRPAPQAVHDDDGDDGGAHIGGAQDDVAQQRVARVGARRLEDERRVEEDRVGARQLLDHRRHHRDHQLRAVVRAQDLPPRLLALAADRLGDVHELHKHGLRAADALQHRLPFLLPPARH